MEAHKSLTAAQLIYTNVEPSLSPTHRGGYQTLCYTHELITPEDLEEIEPRLFYTPSEIQPEKLAFFHLTSGKVALTKIVPIEAPDEFGRKGRYLAHCLVFNAKEFIGAEVSPFDVIRNFKCLNSLSEALDAFDRKSGYIPPAIISVPSAPRPNENTLPLTWPWVVVRDLWLITLKSAFSEFPTIEIISAPNIVAEVIELALFCLPPSETWRISFDTYFYKGNPVTTPYHMVGLLAPSNRIAAVVDPSKPSIRTPDPISPESSIEEFVSSLVLREQIQMFLSNKSLVFQTARFLDGETVPPPELSQASSEILQLSKTVWGKRIETRISDLVHGLFPPRLASIVTNHLIESRPLPELIRFLSQKPSYEELSQLLWDGLLQRNALAETTLLRELRQFVKLHPHPGLVFLCLCWSNQLKALQQFLASLSQDEYKNLVEIALNHRLCPPNALIAADKIRAFLEVWLPRYQESELVPLVQTLLKLGQIDVLNHVLQHAQGFPPEAIKQLTHVLKTAQPTSTPALKGRLHRIFKTIKASLQQLIRKNHPDLL